jgi:MATE family multidrug resistance protein
MFLCALGLGGRAIFVAAPGSTRRALVDGHALAEFFSLSRDITIRTLLLVSTFAVFTNLAAAMGTVVLAATAILRQVVLIAAWFTDGFAFAVESLAGVFHGARRPDRLGATLRISMGWALGTTAVFLVLCIVFPRASLGLLTDKPDLLELASRYRWWLVPVLGLGAPAYVLDGYFLGLTRGRDLRVAMFWSVLLGFAPAAVVAGFSGNVDWLWAALAAFMLARTVTLGLKTPATLATAG